MADEVLRALGSTFDAMYSRIGRPSIPPERLLKASILMALYTVRSERLFCEQLEYNLLFRWFLDMHNDEGSFDHSVFSKNRARLLEHDVAGKFFGLVVWQARDAGLMSDEHFTVDGTLIDAWASLKSFRPKEEKGSDREPPDDPGIPPSTSTARSAATRRTSRRPTRSRAWPARARARRRSCPSRRTR